MLSTIKKRVITNWPALRDHVLEPSSLAITSSSIPPQLLFSLWYTILRYNPDFIDNELSPRAYYIAAQSTFLISLIHAMTMNLLPNKYSGKLYFSLLGTLEKGVNLSILGSYILLIDKSQNNNLISPDGMWAFLSSMIGAGFLVEMAYLNKIEPREIQHYVLLESIKHQRTEEVFIKPSKFTILEELFKTLEKREKNDEADKSYFGRLKHSGSTLYELIFASMQASVAAMLFQWLLALVTEDVESDEAFAAFLMTGAALGFLSKLLELSTKCCDTNKLLHSSANAVKMSVQWFNTFFGVFIQISNWKFGITAIQTDQWTSRGEDKIKPNWFQVSFLIAFSAALTAHYVHLQQRPKKIVLESLERAKNPRQIPEGYTVRTVRSLTAEVDAPPYVTQSTNEVFIDLEAASQPSAAESAAESTGSEAVVDSVRSERSSIQDSLPTDSRVLFFPPKRNGCERIAGFFGRNHHNAVGDIKRDTPAFSAPTTVTP